MDRNATVATQRYCIGSTKATLLMLIACTFGCLMRWYLGLVDKNRLLELKIRDLNEEIANLGNLRTRIDVMQSKLDEMGGTGWSDESDELARIYGKKIIVHWGGYVDSIDFLGSFVGGPGGQRTEIQMSKGEYVTQIKGSCGDVIDKVWIITNLNPKGYGPFGGEGGDKDFVVGDGHTRITQFGGTCKWYKEYHVVGRLYGK
jgi:hypothetical protein